MNELNFPRLLKLLSPIWIGLGLVLFCGGALVLGPVLSNENRLRDYADLLFNYRMPSQTRVIRRETKMWRGAGNGNGCWYEAELVLASTLSQAELEEFYHSLLLSPDRGMVADAGFRQIEASFSTRSAESREIQLTLRLSVLGPETTLDFRCH